MLIFFLAVECFDVILTTKWYGDEISWSLGSCSNSQAYTSHSFFSQQCCVYPGDHTLTCKDSYGDGWNGGFIEIRGKRYCEDFGRGYYNGDYEEATIISIGEPLHDAYC